MPESDAWSPPPRLTVVSEHKATLHFDIHRKGGLVLIVYGPRRAFRLAEHLDSESCSALVEFINDHGLGTTRG